MQAHNLDRRVEPVGIFALVNLMEAGQQAFDGCRIDGARRHGDFDRMLLVLIAAFQE